MLVCLGDRDTETNVRRLTFTVPCGVMTKDAPPHCRRVDVSLLCVVGPTHG